MAQTHVSQTLDRGLQVMELIAGAAEGMTVGEIAGALDVHRTIARRLVATLEQRHFVTRSTAGRYRLGARLIALTASVGGELVISARPFLEALSEATGETVHLVMASGADVLFVDAVESGKALRVASRVGRTLPAHATSVGKALLAAMTDDAVRSVLKSYRLEKVAPRTTTSRADLLKHLQKVRAQGYATAFEESEAGVGSVGVAIIDQAGAVRGALSIAAPAARLKPELPHLIAAATDTARQIAANLRT